MEREKETAQPVRLSRAQSVKRRRRCRGREKWSLLWKEGAAARASLRPQCAERSQAAGSLCGPISVRVRPLRCVCSESVQ